jgi:dGTPase
MSSAESTPDPWLDHEERWLAPYAMHNRASRGRRHPEPPHAFRTPFQRDRERIVHSSAFRRMTGKTQVLVASVNDHHRTRLTHTLEVAQVARTVARRLRLNEDLTEGIALAHDIGHPPFGHAGEQALDECLRSLGGFDHNLNGLRRVDELEERYPGFPGLNLTFEMREAFVRHSKNRTNPVVREFDGVGAPLLEAQVVDVVDSITYGTHDLDDALGLGFIAIEELGAIGLWQQSAAVVRENHPGLEGHAYRTAVIRELLARQVTGLLEDTARRLADERIRTIDDVRAARVELVGFGPELESAKRELEHFLQDRVYRHHRILRMTAEGKRILRALFAEYTRTPELLPQRHLQRWSGAPQIARYSPGPRLAGRTPVPELELVVADYLAGMTDRYAQQEYQRLFSPMNET